MKRLLTALAASVLVLSACGTTDDSKSDKQHSAKSEQAKKNEVKYPKDGVKGIYVTPNSLKGKKFDELIDFINDTDLNTMVIDVKDDSGNITMNLNSDNKLIQKNTQESVNLKKLMKTLKQNHIYSIARIVTFKDSKLAEEHPEWSFKKKDGEVWESDGDDKFINPFSKKSGITILMSLKQPQMPVSKKCNSTMSASLKALRTWTLNCPTLTVNIRAMILTIHNNVWRRLLIS